MVSRHPSGIEPHRARGTCDYSFESVLSFGQARLIAAPAEKLQYLKRFKSYFYRRLGRDENSDPVTEKSAASCHCIVIRIESQTGRRKLA